MTNIYHATPYDISAAGFYFKTLEEYSSNAAAHRNEYGDPIDEYEIQFIDGDNYELFNALNVNQANLALWFDGFEGLYGENAIKAFYLAEDQYCIIEEVKDKLDDVMLFEGTAEDYANQYLEETGIIDQIPQALQYYFDVKSFAQDMILNGEIAELRVDSTNYIVWSC